MPGRRHGADQETYKFDDLTMTGTRSVANSDACDGRSGRRSSSTRSRWRYKGPLPIPVDRYPLYCEPGGLKSVLLSH